MQPVTLLKLLRLQCFFLYGYPSFSLVFTTFLIAKRKEAKFDIRFSFSLSEPNVTVGCSLAFKSLLCCSSNFSLKRSSPVR